MLFLTVCLWQSSLADQRNVALNKKLQYSPESNHAYTKNDKDPFILTDGKKEGQINTPQSTVGWSTQDIIEIDIDLGEVYGVDFINVHTFCGPNNGIEFPEYLIAVSSVDGKRYRFSSFTSTDGWEFSNPVSISRIVRLPVEEKLRYIKLYVRPFASSFFSTEIEVFESLDTGLNINSSDYLSKEQVLLLVERARQLQRDSRELETILKVSSMGNSGLMTVWMDCKKKIAELNARLTDKNVTETELLFANCRAKWFNFKYNVPWLCYRAEPMDVLHHGDLPVDVPENFEISLYQWQNEYGAAAINLVNCSNAAIYFSANFSPLHSDGNAIDSRGIFQLRRGIYIWVPQAGLVTDPLVLQNSKPFPVAPGQTVQLWMDVHTKGLEEGIYVAALSIEAVDAGLLKKRQIVPMKIEVAGSKFPEKLPFFTYNWDYVTGHGFTKDNGQVAVTDLAEHYINVVPIRRENFFKDQNDGGLFSSQKLGREIKERGKMSMPAENGKTFLLFSIGSYKGHFGEFKTNEFNSKFTEFLRQLRNYMLSNGYNYNSFALYPFDENVGWDFIYVAQIIRAFDPNIKIYANRWLGIDKVDLNGELKIVDTDTHFKMIKDLVDIWCPHIQGYILHNPSNRNSDWYDDNLKSFIQYRDTLVEEGKQVWGYHANISRQRFYLPEKIYSSKDWCGDNSKAFRTMPIVAASLGMTGMGFWAYIHGGEDLWELNERQHGHTVVYDGSKNPDRDSIPEFIVPSKRWQQWRLGVQDAVCLMEHKELLEEFFKKSDNLELNDEITSEYLISLRRRADEK